MSILVFFIIIFLLFILICPIKLKSKITYNILKNKGIIKFYFFKINFLTLKIKIKPKYIYLTTKKGKVILVPIEFGDSSNLDYVDLTLILFNKTTVNTLKITLNVGIDNNPFYTALLYGAFQTIFSTILAILKTKKLATIVSNKINTVYTKNNGSVILSSSLTITIFDYIWGLIFYFIKLKRIGKRYETRWF